MLELKFWDLAKKIVLLIWLCVFPSSLYSIMKWTLLELYLILLYLLNYINNIWISHNSLAYPLLSYCTWTQHYIPTTALQHSGTLAQHYISTAAPQLKHHSTALQTQHSPTVLEHHSTTSYTNHGPTQLAPHTLCTNHSHTKFANHCLTTFEHTTKVLYRPNCPITLNPCSVALYIHHYVTPCTPKHRMTYPPLPQNTCTTQNSIIYSHLP